MKLERTEIKTYNQIILLSSILFAKRSVEEKTNHNLC